MLDSLAGRGIGLGRLRQRHTDNEPARADTCCTGQQHTPAGACGDRRPVKARVDADI